MNFWRFVEICTNSLAKFSSYLLIVDFTEVPSVFHAKKGALKSKNLVYFEFLEESHSSCPLLISLNIKGAVLITKGIWNLAHQKRESFSLTGIIFILTSSTTAIEKNILFTRMTVKIDEHPQLSFLALLSYHLFEEENLGVMLATGLFPLAVEVYSRSRETVVASANSIHVDHRDYLDQETIEEILGMLSVS